MEETLRKKSRSFRVRDGEKPLYARNRRLEGKTIENPLLTSCATTLHKDKNLFNQFVECLPTRRLGSCPPNRDISIPVRSQHGSQKCACLAVAPRGSSASHPDQLRHLGQADRQSSSAACRLTDDNDKPWSSRAAAYDCRHLVVRHFSRQPFSWASCNWHHDKNRSERVKRFWIVAPYVLSARFRSVRPKSNWPVLRSGRWECPKESQFSHASRRTHTKKIQATG